MPPNRRFNRSLLNAPIILLAIWSGSAGADDYGITASELQQMPQVCRTLHAGHYAPDAQRLMIPNALPKNMPEVHHFCQGLKFLLRSDKVKSSQDKGFNIQNAVGNFDYVLGSEGKHRSINPGYYAQVHYFKAEALRRNNKYPEMVVEYTKAIKLKPTVPAPYAQLFDYYIKLGDQAEARKIIDIGLEHAPKSSLLLKRKEKLK